jgi:hypothetical protein
VPAKLAAALKLVLTLLGPLLLAAQTCKGDIVKLEVGILLTAITCVVVVEGQLLLTTVKLIVRKP